MHQLSRRRGAVRTMLAVAVLAGLTACEPPPPPDPPDPSSVLVGCDRAAERVTITASSHLDPTCTYTGGFDIGTSNVTFDCQDATIRGAAGATGAGILVTSPTDVALDGVTVRNCKVEGFTNTLRVTRPGFRFLAEGEEFEHPTSNIVVEDSEFSLSRGVGIFVDGYVSGVTIRRNSVHHTGSSGIYLETGSKQSLVEDNQIHNNGAIENGAGGKAFTFAGTDVWYWGPGREGLSIDGSYENTIRGNNFALNSAGGIFLYKNCGEYPDRNPGRWFERRDPADRNLIEGNVFVGGRNGVWIGSRMGENMLPMECSDPKYHDTALVEYVLDHAEDNVVRANRFVDVTYGIRVEDDGNTIEGNRFEGASADRHAVIVGTPHRTSYLDRPVTGTVLRDNVSTIAGNADPYRWVHGHVGTLDQGNTALGAPSSLCEGQAPPRQVMVMVIAVKAALPGGGMPPTPDLTVATLGALPACAPTGGS